MLAIVGGGMRTGSVVAYQMTREVVLLAGGQAPKSTDLAANANKWASADHWVVYKQHGLHDVLKPYLDRVYAIVTYRNQMDVIVSLMHFRKASFTSTLHANACYSNINAYYDWHRALPRNRVVSVRYEEGIVSNQHMTVRRIANLLDIELNDNQVGHIVNKWSINANLRRAKQKNELGSDDYMAERHIYSKGESKWREELTDQQIRSALRIRKIARWQKEKGYEPGG